MLNTPPSPELQPNFLLNYFKSYCIYTFQHPRPLERMRISSSQTALLTQNVLSQPHGKVTEEVIHPNVLCPYPYQNTLPEDLDRKHELTEASWFPCITELEPVLEASGSSSACFLVTK